MTPKPKYTYNYNYLAHYGTRLVRVPDQVADDQRGFATANRSFLAYYDDRVSGKVRVRIDADATGLSTGGTGDLIVKSA